MCNVDTLNNIYTYKNFLFTLFAEEQWPFTLGLFSFQMVWKTSTQTMDPAFTLVTLNPFISFDSFVCGICFLVTDKAQNFIIFLHWRVVTVRIRHIFSFSNFNLCRSTWLIYVNHCWTSFGNIFTLLFSPLVDTKICFLCDIFFFIWNKQILSGLFLSN